MDHRQVDKRNLLIVLKKVPHDVTEVHKNQDQFLGQFKVKSDIHFKDSMNVPTTGVDFDSGVSAGWLVRFCPSLEPFLLVESSPSSRRCNTSRGTLQPPPLR